MPAAYLQILPGLMLLELPQFLYNEHNSLAVVICLMLCTSLTIIGHVRTYCGIILWSCFVDVAIAAYKNIEWITPAVLNFYIIDNLFMALIASGINICCCRLNYQTFEKEQQIIYLSERDALTGLLNRKALQAAVQTHTAEDALCAMILLDLDNFKPLNDTLGHFEGDHCLKDVAQDLEKLFGETDSVSRLGGDEFVIFMPNLKSRDCATDRIAAILQTIPKTYRNDKGEVSITCSIGAAFSQKVDSELYEHLYKAADAAMYRSKERGKNCVSYADEQSA